jgi:hypothetical protein
MEGTAKEREVEWRGQDAGQGAPRSSSGQHATACPFESNGRMQAGPKLGVTRFESRLATR